MSIDPVKFQGHMGGTQGPQGFNRYAYVNNNPIAHMDPTGMQASCGISCITLHPNDFAPEAQNAAAGNGAASAQRAHNIAYNLYNEKKGINTIVTDGSGGLEVQLDNVNGLSEEVVEGVRVHEEEHIAQFYRGADAESRSAVANAPRSGLLVSPAQRVDRLRAEIGAYQVEINYYNNALKIKGLDRTVKKNLRVNRVQAKGALRRVERALEKELGGN